jgi:adenylate cyclase, class 2
MAQNEQELEVKFWIQYPQRLLDRLEGEAALLQPRTHEMNLRFDRPDGSLKSTRQVLRLRRDQDTRLTYKGPGSLQEGVHARREIELVVDNFETARHFIEALGFQVQMAYEKYRTTYRLDEILVTLDEMPYGFFVELEGPDPAAIQHASHTLSLIWDARILDSYTGLFDALKPVLGIQANDLLFTVFTGMQNPLAAIGLHPADE